MANIDSVQTLLANVGTYRYNPSGIQRAVVGMLKDITDGVVELVDPTNPVVFTLEAASVLTAGFMVENQTLNRKQYPFSAQIVEDLYPHMSDKDYVDRFAVPCASKIFFLFAQDELMDKLVTDPVDTGIRKLVIPRNTFIDVGGTIFSIQYPIEIREMAHGGLQIVYIADILSPLQTLTTNIIPWTVIKDDNGVQYVGFEIDVFQFNIVSRTGTISLATGFSTSIQFTQQFYYCRVYVDNGNGTYTEMATTHTDEIYDPTVLTAVLQVVDNTLNVKIPQVYITTGLLNKSIRIDVYQTLGPINLDMGNYIPDQYVVNFFSLNKTELDQFVSPLKTMRQMSAHSTKIANGGSDAMSFAELRLRVIQNAIGAPSLPITNIQIESTLERAGYKVVKNIDNLTNRVFLATRGMPSPEADSDLITAAAAGMCTLSTKVQDAVMLDTVIDNGDIVTITPDTLYRLVSGILEFVPSAEAELLKALPPDQLAIAATDGGYMYSPFHYVMDSANNEFNLRVYYLDAPVVQTKSFVGENDTTLYQVGAGTYLLARTPTGYNLRIQTSSSDDFKGLTDDEVFVQLAYTPTGQVDRAYMLGTLLSKTADGERIYEFNLVTNYRLSKTNELAMLGFQMFDDSDRVLDMPLLTTFDLLFSTTVAMGPQWQLNTIDAKLGLFQLPTNPKAITNEQLTIAFGSTLDHLWARARSVVSESQFQKWTVDVPKLYTQDVYQLDPVTGNAFTIVDGQLVYTKLHSIGDPVIDGQGDPVYQFRIGDVKFDAYGAPIVTAGRDMLRQMDLFMVEGTYYFATNQVSIDYRKTLVDTIVSWLTVDLPTMGDNLLEQTKIYFFPTTTLGSVDVLFSSGLTTTLNAGQNFEVTLYVSGTVYSNNDLRNTLQLKTVQTIGAALQNATIAMSDVIDALRTQYGSDVISLDVKGLGGSSNLAVVTMLDDSKRLSIRKKLVARNDETLALEEDVLVTFIRHERP